VNNKITKNDLKRLRQATKPINH